MAQRYDAVIIGGGHNGLVSAAYLARAGLKTLVLEQRHVLGGAAVTEELFPGFRFSVFSYVVSLLRPEIIRELELPRHGLDILPLDGTFTPLRPGDGPKQGGGDYLWRVNDHGRTIRELRRWSATDAEAYEEYGQLMVEMARFIKPILAIMPPDLTSLDPRPLLPLAGLARRFQQLPERQQAVFVQLMTMSAADFLDQWFETDPLKATMCGVGDHRHVPGRPLARHGLRPAPPLHGRDRRRVPGVGHPEGRHRRDLERDRLGGPRARRRDPDRGAASPGSSCKNGRATGRRARVRRGDRGDRRALARSTRGARSSRLLEPGALDAEFEDEVRRFKFRGSSGKVNLAVDRLPDFIVPARSRRAPPRRDLVHRRASTTWSRPTTTRSTTGSAARPYIDMIIPTLVDPSMAPPGKHVISCFVQYAPYKLAPELGTWDDQREAFGDAVIDRIAEFAPNIRDVILYRNVQTPLDIERTTGPDRGQHLPGRAVARAAVLQPAGARLRAVPDAGPGPLAVRLGDPSGRRDHGRERPDRGAGAAPGARPEGGLRWRRAERDGGTGGYDARSSSGAATTASSTAAYLARAGRRVLVLERRNRLGGAAETSELRRRPRPAGWRTRSAGCGRRSSATSTCGATACASSHPTSAPSPRRRTAGR